MNIALLSPQSVDVVVVLLHHQKCNFIYQIPPKHRLFSIMDCRLLPRGLFLHNPSSAEPPVLYESQKTTRIVDVIFIIDKLIKKSKVQHVADELECSRSTSRIVFAKPDIDILCFHIDLMHSGDLRGLLGFVVLVISRSDLN